MISIFFQGINFIVGETSDAADDEKHGVVDSKKDFGVAQANQLLLSKIRTDLDAFSDYEVYALEKDAYQMSAKRLKALKESIGVSVTDNLKGEWKFDSLKQRLGDKDDEALTKQLLIGEHKFFKTFRQNFLKSVIAHTPLLFFFLAVGFGIYYLVETFYPAAWHDFLQLRVVDIWYIVAGLVISISLSWLADRIVGKKATRIIEIMKFPYRIIYVFAVNIIAPFLIAVPIWLYLKFVNPLFLKLGSVK